jgi:PAS domain S-box-containing protein
LLRSKIIYLRDDDSLDGKIELAAASLGVGQEMAKGGLGQVDGLQFDPGQFKIIIARGEIRDRLAVSTSQFSFRRNCCLIEIIPGEIKPRDFCCIRNFWLEQISEKEAEEIDTLSCVLKKNLYILEQTRKDSVLLNEIIQLIPDGVLLFNKEGDILESNSRITGIPVEELRKHRIFDFLDEQTGAKVRKMMKAHFSDNSTMSIETSVRNVAGRLVPISVSTRLVDDESGDPQYYLSVLTDITSEKNVKEKGRLLSHLVDASPHAIFAVKEDKTVIIWNGGGERIFGLKAAAAIGENVDSIFPDEEFIALFHRLILEVKEESRAKRRIMDFRTGRNGPIKLELDLFPLYEDDGQFWGVSVTARDVTVQQKRIDEITVKNEEMEHLINVVSHEMRTPVHSIDNYVSFLQEALRGKLQDESVFEMMERMQANLTNMEALIKDLTDFSKASLDFGNEVAVDLESVVDEIVTNLQWQVGKEKVIVNTSKLPAIRINPSRIYQIFENLLTNAFKFRKGCEPARTEIEFNREDDRAVFTVRDFGIGISPQHHEKIFNLFYRAREKEVEGTGAGLAITRKIINSYGGRIWVEPGPGDGTMFKFFLPARMIVKVDE